MKEKIKKTVLLVAASSDIGKSIYKLLLEKGYNVLGTSRKDENLYYLDVASRQSFEELFEKIKDKKFDYVINCAGVAISSPVQLLGDDPLSFQLEVGLYGVLRLLRTFKSLLNNDARVINISSMAAFGIFPFISPYSISKASSDILLNAFEIETGIRTISIKPGVVGTSFWNYCLDINKDNFENFKNEYEQIGSFLIENAKNNSQKGVTPFCVAKRVLDAMTANIPRHSYTVGRDALVVSFTKFIPKIILNPLIRFVLKQRVKHYIKGNKNAK